MQKITTLVLLVAAMLVALAASASATIHPLVESGDCAQGVPQNSTGDIMDPPGQTWANPANGRNDHAAIMAVTRGFTDLSSPALFGHKFNSQCGKVGHG